MTAFPSPRRLGRRLGALAAPFAWLLAFATPPRLADEPPLFWIGRPPPLPSPLEPGHAPGRGHAAPPTRESRL